MSFSFHPYATTIVEKTQNEWQHKPNMLYAAITC
jgi:hypothetical protein